MQRNDSPVFPLRGVGYQLSVAPHGHVKSPRAAMQLRDLAQHFKATSLKPQNGDLDDIIAVAKLMKATSRAKLEIFDQS